MKTLIPICIAIGIVIYLKWDEFTYDTAVFFKVIKFVEAYPLIAFVSSIMLIGLSVWLFPQIAVRKMKRFDF